MCKLTIFGFSIEKGFLALFDASVDNQLVLEGLGGPADRGDRRLEAVASLLVFEGCVLMAQSRLACILSSL